MNFERILFDMIDNAVPILFCVLGGNFAYKVNVLNISMEGMLLMGAFSSVLFLMLSGSMLVGILGAVCIVLVSGWIFSFMSITRKGNPIISGLAINLLATSITAFVLKSLSLPNINVNHIVDVAGLKVNIPLLQDIPVIGSIVSGHSPLTYIAFVMIFVSWLLMYRTKFGVYVRVVGENEEATESVGIRGTKIKYIAVLIGALSCAFAGINLAVERLALFTNDMSAGIGFIAIAAIFCGKGRPSITALYAMLFGLCQSLSVNLNISAGPASGLFKTLPYIMIVTILAAVSIIQTRKNYTRGFKNE